MVPTPQELSPPKEVSLDGDQVVISGMSGQFPQAANIMELSDILYNKVNPITETDRWEYNNPETRSKIGQIPDLTKFDAQFFRVQYRTAQSMEPVARRLVEQSFEAVYDAGMCPGELSGKKVSVYVGRSFSEMDIYCQYDIYNATGSQLLGWSKTMMANRISYALNLKGPSLYLTTACASSFQALKLAIRDIQHGVSEAALVCAANNVIQPFLGIQYSRMLECCHDGKMKSFDENADGLVRSDSAVVLFLQKAKNAKRVYGEVVNVDISFQGLVNDVGGFERDPKDFYNYLEKFYNNSPVSPEAVEYVEAFGLAQPQTDKMELDVIDKIFCKGRKQPLPVGSVTSNIGWAEAASGLNSIVKVLLGYHTGKLAGNLHCEKPRQDVAAVREGRLRILTDHHEFSRSYVAVNNLSITGCNGHLLLKGHYKPKDLSRYQTSLPRLVTLMGRIESSVTRIIEDLKSRPIDPEEIALLHGINSKGLSGYLGRGYVILDTNKEGETISLVQETTHFDQFKRPLWFVYSGMGSQWAGMGAQLMRIPVFADAIKRCRKVLEPKGVDIVHIITSPDKTIFDNILNSFVGIAAIQIGLTDVLTSIGIVPDMIIGHSVGELGCAYADDCITAEEMILASYSRGLVSVQTPFIFGAMAAVAIGYEEINTLLPEDIYVACHNSPQSSTISGPADKVKAFVDDLKAKGIFAKEVPCSNIAYHSKYIDEAGPGLLKYLKEVIKDPKHRSPRWVSTSVPQDMWHEPAAALSSAEYHTNNLLNPVLFEEASRLIPRDAVLVEIAPHGLLQAILKRSLPESCVNIALTRRGHPDNTLLVLDAIGKLYVEGYYPIVENLYPKVQFPVSTGTPMLYHLIEWSHSEIWDFEKLYAKKNKQASMSEYIVSLFDDEYKCLSEHVMGGRIVYPVAAILVNVWDTLATWLNKPKKMIPVTFSDVYIHSQLPIHEQTALKINVTLQRGSGNFEVMNGDIKVASGNVLAIIGDHARPIYALRVESKENMIVTADDIYNTFEEKGFQYQGAFRSLNKASTFLTEADVIWNQDWVTFLDGVLQLHTLNQPHDYISQPCYIGSVTIDYRKQIDNVVIEDNVTYATANILDSDLSIIRCGGVIMKRLKYKNVQFVRNEKVLLKSLRDEKIYTNNESKRQEQNIATIKSAKLGDINSLEWVLTSESSRPGIPVNVHYAAVSDFDAKIAAGVYTARENGYGMDFSGLTDRSIRVMGLVNGGAVSSRVKAQPELLWPVPDHWTLEDAATVPSAYAMAFYCLVMKSDFSRGMSILVHGGCGALGQAVINIALAHGAEVFTTVSSSEKKKFLLRLNPDLKEDDVGYSRDDNFADMVRYRTNGKGADLIINTLKGELKSASLNCGGTSAITLDLAQIPNKERYSLRMFNFSKARNYVAVDFNSIFEKENINQRKMLHQLISDGIKAGYVRPLTRVTYAPEQTVRAFRLLADSNHRGRVLIRINDHDQLAQPRFACSPGGSQLVVCAGALGTHWAERLVRRGATHIVLHAPAINNYLNLKLQSWKSLGVNVQISVSDLNNKHNIDNLITQCEGVAPLQGIYIISAKLNDTNKHQMDSIVANIDSAARKLSSTVQYFNVVTAEDKIGKSTFDSRVKDSLPATFVNINELINGEKLQWRYAVEAMERALLSNQPAVSAGLESLSATSLLQQISEIADFHVPTYYSENTSLKDLGLTPEKVSLVLSFFSNVHNLSLSEELIHNLTVKKIRELEETLFGKTFKELKGLSKLLPNISTNDFATQTILKKTLVQSANDIYETGKPYLFILPGLDNDASRFDTLCERLKIPAIVLNNMFDMEAVNESMQKLADKLAKFLLEVLLIRKTNSKFYLLGYETRAAVALELAAALEKKGLTGTVFCLGGAPEEIKVNLNNIANEYSSEEDLETALLTHISASMANNVENLELELANFNTWKEKLEAAMKLIRGRTITTITYTRAVMEHINHNFKQARSLGAGKNNLQSKVVLLRASDVPGIDDVQGYSAQHLAVHNLSTPLSLIAQDLKVSAIINSYVQSDIP